MLRKTRYITTSLHPDLIQEYFQMFLRAEHVIRQTGDVAWNVVTSEKLRNFVAECVAVVLQEMIAVPSRKKNIDSTRCNFSKY